MRGLTAFQDAFTAALDGRADGLAPWLAEPDGRPGLAVYRNTSARGAVDALAAAYPTVQRLVGEEWFAAAAHLYACEHPPARASLLGYGGGFADWLAEFEPARALPYLPDVARIDALWMQAFFAADASPLAPDALSGLDAGAFARTAAALHPAVRLAWFEDNTPSLWLANRPPAEAPERFVLAPVGEGLLIARPALGVEVRRLDAAAFAFLDACAAGRTLAAAAAAAITADPAADLLAILTLCLEAGVFVGLRPAPEPQP